VITRTAAEGYVTITKDPFIIYVLTKLLANMALPKTRLSSLPTQPPGFVSVLILAAMGRILLYSIRVGPHRSTEVPAVQRFRLRLLCQYGVIPVRS